MKFVLFFAVLQMNVAYGQPITLSVKDVPIEKVFKKIEQQTDYKFLYASQLLADIPVVTISVKKVNVKWVLDSILKERKLGYVFNGNTIIIRPSENLRITIKAPPNKSNVLEERTLRTGDSMVANGVNIVIKTTPYWTIIETKNGAFSLINIEKDSLLLVSSRACAKSTTSMQIKKVASIQRIVIMRGYREMQVWVYERPHHPIVVYKKKVVGVKVVLQTDCKKSNAIWVPLRKSPGDSLIQGAQE